MTGKSPLPIWDEEEVPLEGNLPAQELCEQVDAITAEGREGLLLKALAVSNERCNSLISRQNALIGELTQQVKNVEWNVIGLDKNLSENNGQLLKDLRQSNSNLLDNLKATIHKITGVATQIQSEVSTAMESATDMASARINRRINEVADKAIAKIDEQSDEIAKKVKATGKEIDEIKDDIHFERGFRKFFFWATPLLVLAQAVVSVFLLLH